jgi:hypothetical protein
VLVGLAVHGDQGVSDAGQRGGRHGGAAQEGTGPALGGHLATQQQLATLDLTTVLVGQGRERRVGAHHALDTRNPGTGAHGTGVGAASEQ